MPDKTMNASSGRAGVIRARDDSGSMDKLVSLQTLDALAILLVWDFLLSLINHPHPGLVA